MQNNHRAKAALTALNKAHPDLNKIVDLMAFSSYSKNHESWPANILLPSNAWMGISAHLQGIEASSFQVYRSKIANFSKQLRFLGTWSKTQGIYRFDPTIYEALIDTPLTGEIPSSALQRMPEWCMYLETPGLHLFKHTKIHGCWIMNEYSSDNAGRSEVELSVMLDADVPPIPNMPALTFSLPLDTQQSLEDVLQTFQRKAVSDLGAAFAQDIVDSTKTLHRNLQAILSLTLYICTQNDFRNAKQTGTPSNPLPERKKGAMRVFSPSSTTDWDVGVRMGSAIRRSLDGAGSSEGSVSGVKVRPHMRGFHWHGFRVGKAKDAEGNQIPAIKRDLIVKFLPPIGVNMPDDMEAADLPAVIRPVR